MRGWVRELGENLSVRQPEADVTSDQLLNHVVHDGPLACKRGLLAPVAVGDESQCDTERMEHAQTLRVTITTPSKRRNY